MLRYLYRISIQIYNIELVDIQVAKMRIRSPNLLFNTFILLLLLAAPTNQMAIMRSWLFGSSETTNYHPAILDSPRRHSPSAFLDETHNPHLQAIINEAKLNEAELDQQHQTAVTAQSNQVNHLDHIDSDEKAMEALMLWFSIHDLDSNGFLDGHELLKVFAEWAVQGML